MVGLKICIVVLSTVYLASTTLVLHVDAADFCGTALDKPLCEKVVKGATDWNQAITKAITEATNEVSKVSKSGSCAEAYKNTLDKLKESMEAAKSGNKDGSLNFKLSAALTNLGDCENEAKDKAAVKATNKNAEQAIRVCLAVDKSKPAK